ncbi:MAG: GNAT family N-acetyltransferase [Desulfobacteraceae bacterium]|nr:GNAT family N-acetyltransferase [Desulfobacteraceae bacterium]MCB9494888.1 GNAT family N-acetyltransferase [Desulfobacteraceae bacterium]
MPDEIIKIENASEDDIDTLYQAELILFKNPWTLKNFEDEFKQPEKNLKKAVFKSRICGFAVSRKILDELHILKICSFPGYERKKIGSLLLNFIIKESKANICFLEVSEENLKALSFYKKNGFIITGRRKNYYGDGFDALNMTKDLSGGT